jgi:hypothetical protein
MDSKMGGSSYLSDPRIDSLPAPLKLALTVFAGTGFAYTFYFLLSFARLLLSLFVLPGIPVSLCLICPVIPTQRY